MIATVLQRLGIENPQSLVGNCVRAGLVKFNSNGLSPAELERTARQFYQDKRQAEMMARGLTNRGTPRKRAFVPRRKRS